VRSIETDILNGALAPDSRLGIIETAARCGIKRTPWRDALSWLAPRGLKRDRQAGLSRLV
jgi:DNA-binding GntR family transcriptional regulator